MLHHVKLIALIQPVYTFFVLLPCPDGIRYVIQTFIKLASDTLGSFHHVLFKIYNSYFFIQHINIIANLLRKYISFTNTNSCTKAVKLSFTPPIGEVGERIKAPRKPRYWWGEHSLLDIRHRHNAFRFKLLSLPPSVYKLFLFACHQVVTCIFVARQVFNNLALSSK